MLRIAEPDILTIKVLVRRMGRIKFMGNLMGIRLIRVKRRLIGRIKVGKSEVVEGLLLL